MDGEKDYRNTKYCPALSNVEEKKETLEEEIKSASSRTKIIYNKVRERGSEYHRKFMEIYNRKCAYCGAMLGLLPVDSFEIDHFLSESSFPDTIAGRIEAGKMKNLVWACISCNRGKSGVMIKPPYDKVLDVDSGNIAIVFKRNKDYSIQICDTYQEDEFIQQFYEKLHLGYETRRLDYLGLQLEGMYQNEEDPERKSKIGETLSLLLKKRNYMTVAGEKLQ